MFFLKRLTIGTLYHGWISLMSSNLNFIKRTVIFSLSVIFALFNSASYALVNVVIHNNILHKNWFQHIISAKSSTIAPTVFTAWWVFLCSARFLLWRRLFPPLVIRQVTHPAAIPTAAPYAIAEKVIYLLSLLKLLVCFKHNYILPKDLNFTNDFIE